MLLSSSVKGTITILFHLFWLFLYSLPLNISLSESPSSAPHYFFISNFSVSLSLFSFTQKLVSDFNVKEISLMKIYGSLIETCVQQTSKTEKIPQITHRIITLVYWSADSSGRAS